MTTIPFDTLAVRQRLIASGFTAAQADEMVAIAREAAGDVLATKADLRDLVTRTDLAQLELRLMVRHGGMLAVAVAILAVVVKLASS